MGLDFASASDIDLVTRCYVWFWFGVDFVGCVSVDACLPPSPQADTEEIKNVWVQDIWDLFFSHMLQLKG